MLRERGRNDKKTEKVPISILKIPLKLWAFRPNFSKRRLLFETKFPLNFFSKFEKTLTLFFDDAVSIYTVTRTTVIQSRGNIRNFLKNLPHYFNLLLRLVELALLMRQLVARLLVIILRSRLIYGKMPNTLFFINILKKRNKIYDIGIGNFFKENGIMPLSEWYKMSISICRLK